MSSSSTSRLHGLRFIQYARKSSDREDRQVQSLHDQAAVLAPIVLRERLTVVDQFQESRSAKNPDNRPFFSAMLARIERGEADAILCWHINRLVRNRKEAGHLEQLLIDGKIQCIKTPEREYWSGDNALYLALETAQAAQYSRDLSHDVKRATREKADRGHWPHRSKLGYRVNADTHDVEAHPEHFAFLERAWRLMLTENYTVAQVADELTAAGFRVKANREHADDAGPRVLRPIARSVLYRLFRDPFYAGLFLYDGTLRPGKHPAMVTPTEFEKVQRFLSRHHKIQPKKHEFAYTGLIKCGACGGFLTAETKIKRYATTGRTATYTYYHCIGRSGCRKTSVSVAWLDDAVREWVRRCQVRDADMVRWAADQLEDDAAIVPSAFDAMDADQQRSLARAKASLDEVYTMRESRELTPAEFLDRKERYTATINSLTLAIETRTHLRQTVTAETAANLRYAPDLLTRFDGGAVREQRAVAHLVAESYVLTLDTSEPHLHVHSDPLFDRIRSFERQNDPSQQVGTGCSGADSLVWRTFLASILNLIDEQVASRMERSGSENSASISSRCTIDPTSAGGQSNGSGSRQTDPYLLE